MIADAHPELDPHRPRPVRETDEWRDRYAGRTIEIKSAFAPAARASTRAGRNSPESKTGLDLRAGPAAPAHALNPAQQAARRRAVLRQPHTSYSLYAGHDVVEVLTKCRVQHLSHGDVRFVDARRC